MQPDDRIIIGNTLGEGVLWDGSALWWTDIDGCTLYHLTWPQKTLRAIKTPARLASFGFIEDSSKLIAAFDSGFALFDPETGGCSPFLTPPGLLEGQRLNDGRVDRQGRFWCGSMVQKPSYPHLARLYTLADGALHSPVDGLSIGNGLAFSPDSRVFYFADSLRHRIWCCDFDAATGRLGPRREFAVLADGVEPDGATVDADGCLWSAMWGGDCVVRYTPDGRIDKVIEVPVHQPSCVAFGGPDRDLLFVTSARLGLGEGATGAGDVLVYNVKIKGLPESRFKIENWPETGRT
jgi:Gluconolactonase